MTAREADRERAGRAGIRDRPAARRPIIPGDRRRKVAVARRRIRVAESATVPVNGVPSVGVTDAMWEESVALSTPAVELRWRWNPPRR